MRQPNVATDGSSRTEPSTRAGTDANGPQSEAERERAQLEAESASTFKAMMDMLIEDARSGQVNPADKRRGRADRRSEALHKSLAKAGLNQKAVEVDRGPTRTSAEQSGGSTASAGREALAAAQGEVLRVATHGRTKVGKDDDKPGFGFQGLDQLL